VNEILDMERRLEEIHGPIPRHTARRNRVSLVYFIQARHGGPIKVGIATNPRRRLRELQTAHAHELVIRRMTPGGLDLEQKIHKQFAHLRLRGEWFTSAQELMEFIETLPVVLESPEQNV
jgi:hypothetical protein